MVIGSRYQAYKQATSHVVDWIHRAAEHALDALNRARPELFDRHADLPHLYADAKAHRAAATAPPMRAVNEMLKLLEHARDADGSAVFSPHKAPALFAALPAALTHCAKAIDLRTASLHAFRRNADLSDARARESIVKHRHFVEVMKVWQRKLAQLLKIGRKDARKEAASASLHQSFAVLGVAAHSDDSDDDGEDGDEDKHARSGDILAGDGCATAQDCSASCGGRAAAAAQTPHARPGDDANSSPDRPAAIASRDAQPDERADRDSPDVQPKKTVRICCAKCGNFVSNDNLDNIEDFDDIAFVLQFLVSDMDDIMSTVAGAWRGVRDGTSNFVYASLLSLMALRQVKELTATLEREFPEIKSFEDLESALSLSPVDGASIAAQLLFSEARPTVALKLVEYGASREYPAGSLLTVMRFVAEFLRRFATAVPTGAPARLFLRDAAADAKPFDEMARPVADVNDFWPFCREHLPALYNAHLGIGDLFAGIDSPGHWPQFPLFREVLREFAALFALARLPDRVAGTSIPLVFLTAMWYHSVQVIQGGMLLGRTTAITRNALRGLKEALGNSMHNCAEDGAYFVEAIKKTEHVLGEPSLYRNHPFMAGVLALDLSVNLSVNGGLCEIAGAPTMHRMMHLYNAMVRSGKLKPFPFIERFLTAHARALFNPVRPSHSFLLSMSMATPPVSAEAVSEVYRLLVLREDFPAATPKTFLKRARHLCEAWLREFTDHHLLAFNYSAFADGLTNIAIALNSFISASVRNDEDVVVYLVTMCDTDLGHPDHMRCAVEIMRQGFTKLCGMADKFDLLPRVACSMQALMFGSLNVRRRESPTADDRALFSRLMALLDDGAGALSTDEFNTVFKNCRERPVLLGMHDPALGGPHMLFTTIFNRAAAGPRAHPDLLEVLLHLDGLRLKPPVGALHACAAAGLVAHLRVLLEERNNCERNSVCPLRGNTALHYAAAFGHADVIEHLAVVGVDCSIKNKDGKTAMDLAKSERIRGAIRDVQRKRSFEKFRLRSRARSGTAYEEARRKTTEAKERRERVHMKLNERREMSKTVLPISATDEARAKQNELELLAMLEEEEKKAANGPKAQKRKGKGKGKGKNGKGKKR